MMGTSDEFGKEFNPKWSEASFHSLPKTDPEYRAFLEYGIADTMALYNSIIRARELLFKLYRVGVAECYSTASLSRLILQTKFYNAKTDPIPTFSAISDGKIRPSYYGGRCNAYGVRGNNLHLYDVNSLYPWAMCKTMPGEVIASVTPFMNLDNIFGFVEAFIEYDGLKPILPYRIGVSLVYPRGR